MDDVWLRRLFASTVTLVVVSVPVAQLIAVQEGYQQDGHRLLYWWLSRFLTALGIVLLIRWPKRARDSLGKALRLVLALLLALPWLLWLSIWWD